MAALHSGFICGFIRVYSKAKRESLLENHLRRNLCLRKRLLTLYIYVAARLNGTPRFLLENHHHMSRSEVQSINCRSQFTYRIVMEVSAVNGWEKGEMFWYWCVAEELRSPTPNIIGYSSVWIYESWFRKARACTPPLSIEYSTLVPAAWQG